MKLFANTASRHNQVDVCYYLGIFLFKSHLKYFVLSVSKLEEINIYRRTFNFSNMVLKLIDTNLISKMENLLEKNCAKYMHFNRLLTNNVLQKNCMCAQTHIIIIIYIFCSCKLFFRFAHVYE